MQSLSITPIMLTAVEEEEATTPAIKADPLKQYRRMSYRELNDITSKQKDVIIEKLAKEAEQFRPTAEMTHKPVASTIEETIEHLEGKRNIVIVLGKRPESPSMRQRSPTKAA